MGGKANILIIDDDPVFCAQVASYIGKQGYACTVGSTLEEGLSLARRKEYDVVFLDMILPDGDGLTIIDDLQRTPSKPEVVVITGKSDPDTADRAIRSGAWYFLHKPTPLNAVKALVERIVVFRELNAQYMDIPASFRHRIKGDSQALNRCLEMAVRASRSDEYVLVTGETGTGKELVAEAIHMGSSRSEGPLVPVDCTAIPETLAESILFGHVKGAFTSADSSRAGLMAQANGGTLLLDEVGDLPLNVQKSLLRALQEKKFRPLSSGREQVSDFRVIAATNRNLKAMVASGEFRKDLYYRLSTFTIKVPPMRERLEDLPALVTHYVKKLAPAYGGKVSQVSDETLEALSLHDWPGNVRELVSVVHSMVASAGGEGRIYPHHLPMEIRALFHSSHVPPATGGQTSRRVQDDAGMIRLAEYFPRERESGFPKLSGVREQVVDKMEHFYLQRLLATHPESASRACETSGLSRSRLYQLLAKHGMALK